MLYIVLKCLVCLLAAYGLLILVHGAFELIRCRISGDHPKVRIVLLVKDAEEYIEYIVRNAIKKDFASKALSDKNMIIVDMKSADQTYLLLQKLQKDFSNIEALAFEERELIFDDFSIFSSPT
jgi:hypothetical protein